VVENNGLRPLLPGNSSFFLKAGEQHDLKKGEPMPVRDFPGEEHTFEEDANFSHARRTIPTTSYYKVTERKKQGNTWGHKIMGCVGVISRVPHCRACCPARTTGQGTSWRMIPGRRHDGRRGYAGQLLCSYTVRLEYHRNQNRGGPPTATSPDILPRGKG